MGTIACRLLPDKPLEAMPGDMWFAPWLVHGEHADYHRRHTLAPNYFNHHAGKRVPIVVCLPDGTRFCVDELASSGGDGWVVTGEAPRITVTPSIDVKGGWHGYLTDGVLSLDVSGRTWP